MTKFPPPIPPRIPDVADSEWGEIDVQEVLACDPATNTSQASIDRWNESVAPEVVAAVATVSNTAPWPQERYVNGELRAGDPEAWNEGENDDG